MAPVAVEGIWRQFVDRFASMVAAYIVVGGRLKNRLGGVRFFGAVENCLWSLGNLDHTQLNLLLEGNFEGKFARDSVRVVEEL